MNKEIKDMSVVELKAIAFDVLAGIEQGQNNLRVINQELANRANNSDNFPKVDEASRTSTDEKKPTEKAK